MEGKVKTMCKIIDFTSKLVRESEIYWDIIIDTSSNERIGIMRNPANEQVMIYITTNSFDRIQIMREKALAELKQQLLQDGVEYV